MLPHTSQTLALTLIVGAWPHGALPLRGLRLGPRKGEVSPWTQGRSHLGGWDVYFPGVPRGDEWKLALGVDTWGEEEENMWVLLK